MLCQPTLRDRIPPSRRWVGAADSDWPRPERPRGRWALGPDTAAGPHGGAIPSTGRRTLRLGDTGMQPAVQRSPWRLGPPTSRSSGRLPRFSPTGAGPGRQVLADVARPWSPADGSDGCPVAPGSLGRGSVGGHPERWCTSIPGGVPVKPLGWCPALQGVVERLRCRPARPRCSRGPDGRRLDAQLSELIGCRGNGERGFPSADAGAEKGELQQVPKTKSSS
jgi:hypothetical protein